MSNLVQADKNLFDLSCFDFVTIWRRFRIACVWNGRILTKHRYNSFLSATSESSSMKAPYMKWSLPSDHVAMHSSSISTNKRSITFRTSISVDRLMFRNWKKKNIVCAILFCYKTGYSIMANWFWCCALINKTAKLRTFIMCVGGILTMPILKTETGVARACVHVRHGRHTETASVVVVTEMVSVLEWTPYWKTRICNEKRASVESIIKK